MAHQDGEGPESRVAFGPNSRGPASIKIRHSGPPASPPAPSPAPPKPPIIEARRLPPPEPEDRRGFWERVRRFFNPPRKLKFTREGKYYLGITLGVGFAAINTGNNLLYLLLGMLL